MHSQHCISVTLKRQFKGVYPTISCDIIHKLREKNRLTNLQLKDVHLTPQSSKTIYFKPYQFFETSNRRYSDNSSVKMADTPQSKPHSADTVVELDLIKIV